MSENVSTIRDCTGCWACYNACPAGCIVMKPAGRSGHIRPHVEAGGCVGCGLCLKACPSYGEIDLHYPLKAFASRVRDKSDYMTSSSGGMASVLSSHVIGQGGVVYGCCADGIDIRHVRAASKDELPKFKGSKYVQSSIYDAFRKIKTDLAAGLPVLFIGTPCQVAGLRKYIGRVPDRLYLVDLICHGVPSRKMFSEHLRHVTGKEMPDAVSFRTGSRFELTVYSSGKLLYKSEFWRDPFEDMYYRAFFYGVSYRDSCYKCRFARPERVSDITIGDFWGIKNPDTLPFGTEDGLSVALPVTEKGLVLLDAVEDRLFIEERPVGEAVSGNDQLRHPFRFTRRVSLFRMLYGVLPFDAAARLAFADRQAVRWMTAMKHKILQRDAK
ncbi:MAG: Coenzyme F420 hydrogenase/dehydrogenase, beta subunit C-terminal domain [Bacteroidetes bacterium]|uniref:Coenzyme F420 hydrogenase/dehydrogenase, beta subunit C-terminal domain n=1 Tax=Candidatus Cryptobacteroides merdavium TaxID=2840769 RepID=A0A9D9H8N4_9BACT|nr:Coenzyme F420 hydrogenase/dehydrogenase, beta subunit C-terminal domain [Candidatus Cryptobacteroides merdavium]